MSARRRGRPTQLTSARTEAICANLRLSLPLPAAAEAAGVARSTVFAWRQRGAEEPGSIYAEFLDRTDVAIAEGQRALAEVVYEAATRRRDWKAALALLGRRFPSEWSETRRQEITGPDGGPAMLDLHTAIEIAVKRAAGSR